VIRGTPCPGEVRPYLVVDIEGSTGTWSREDTLSGTPGWRLARRAMTEDVNGIVEGLAERTGGQIVVKDFHRDGYNIVPSLLHKRAVLVRGYYFKPHLMYGDLRSSNMAFFIGMHAGSGSSGFLPHTLTSRISRILVNDEPLCETQVFAHVLGEAGVPVTFVSGCPGACAEAKRHLPWVVTCPVPKDESRRGCAPAPIREELRTKAQEALMVKEAPLYRLTPPFCCQVSFRNELTARRSNGWRFPRDGAEIRFECSDGASLVMNLIKLAYFTPLTFQLLPYLLPPGRMLLGLLDCFR